MPLMTDQVARSLPPERPNPADAARRSALCHLEVLDEASEAYFSRIISLAADLFEAPSGGILFRESGRTWFKSRDAIRVSETLRDGSFERHTVASDGVFFVCDASADPRFKDHPRVAAPPHVRFYVGAPLVACDGQRIGALVAMANAPRPAPTELQQRLMLQLAADVMARVELRVEQTRRELAVASHEAILRGTSESLVTVGPDWRVKFVSNGHDGPLPEVEPGRALSDLLPATAGSRLAQALQRGMVEREVSDFDEFYPPLRQPMNFRIFPMEPAGIVVSCREASRASKAEFALRASEARLHRSEEHLTRAQRLAQVGSAEMDYVTGQSIWSDEIYRILGLEPGSVSPSNDTFYAMIHPEDRDLVRDNRERLLRGERVPECEYRIRRPNGVERILSRVGEVHFGESGNPLRYTVTIQDVTERRTAERQRDELERQLQQARRLDALGTLAGGMAHDLNNTLVPVLALTKLLLKDRPDGEDRRKLEVILLAGERARDLVRQVLTFSRNGRVQRRRIDLRAAIAESLEILRAGINPAIRIEERLAPVGAAFVDSGQMHQVIVNLVTNAAQAIGDRKGIIAVALEALPDASEIVRLTITDDGPGMDENTLSRMFEPFFTTKGLGGGFGSGLGLSIVHGIVTGHGGSIAATSSPGTGTRFTIDLPILSPSAADKAA
jgi:PAS domain S-box-containing protein